MAGPRCDGVVGRSRTLVWLQAYRLADACDHAEHTAKPEIGRSDSSARLPVIAFWLRRFSVGVSSRAADAAKSQPLDARASTGYETKTISRHVEWRPRRGVPSALIV